MLHFAAKVVCPLCGHRFAVRLTARDKADADARLGGVQTIVAECPWHGGSLRLRLPGSAFRPAEPAPPAAPEPPAAETPSRWRRWWR